MHLMITQNFDGITCKFGEFAPNEFWRMKIWKIGLFLKCLIKFNLNSRNGKQMVCVVLCIQICL